MSNFEELEPNKSVEDEKERLRIDRCNRVIKKIHEWAISNNHEIANIKSLTGGFVNLVLLVETVDGKMYVAKNFVDKNESDTTKQAQKMLSRISKEDEKIIPDVIAWIDDDILISERAEGQPIKSILKMETDIASNYEESRRCLFGLGKMLGSIHERTQSHYGGSGETGVTDSMKIITKIQDTAFLEKIEYALTPEELARVAENILTLTNQKHLTVIHGDTHLDQFFFAPDESLITIVDYDSFRIGDPMFDVARTLASLRTWCGNMDISPKDEDALTQEFINGYREARQIGSLHDENEFSYSRVVAYELRLYIITLDGYISKGISKESKEFKSTMQATKACLEYLLALEI